MAETDNRKLNDLRVVDLRLELEKRDLDKTGVKAVLLERLQNALKEEGHDPDTYVFEEISEVKRTPGRGRKSDNEEVSEDDKGEEDEDVPKSEQDKENKEITKSNDEKDTKKNSDVKAEETKEAKEIVKDDEKVKVEKSESPKKEDSMTKTEIKETKNETEKKKENGPNDIKKEVEQEKKSNENQTKPKEEIKVESKKDASKKPSDSSTAEASKKTPVKTTPSEETSAKTPNASAAKEDKSTTEANGVIDNEDSINLTIGEDEAKMLADEEDSSQEKDHKDESHGSASQKKSTVGEKSQEKTNQEKMDGKSSTAGEKAAKDDKSKKTSATAGGTSKNLWVSGLATTTRATDLKQVFSKYGKVIGAKVVTNARTPGARCYGYVTMSNPEDANKAVQFLHHTELHGRLISVEKAKGDSTGPPKRTEPAKVESPVKKVEEKKKEPVVRKIDPKKEENIVPPGTEGDVKEPEAPGTEKETSEAKTESKESGHRSRETIRTGERAEKRTRSATSHRSRGGSPVLTFEKIKEERERQRLRERERMLREEERRRETERIRQREIDRKQREEFDRLDREKKKIKMEREKLLREKDELLKLKSERQRLERERQKLEREKLEKEKEELERLKRQNMRLEEEARRKRSLSASRDQYESRKRPATDARYVGHHSSSTSRYPDSARANDYKKESSHKSSRDLGGPPRRPGFEPETSRRMVTSVSSSRESWPPKERESARYERSSVNSSSFREDSISSRSKPSERLVRERYAEGPKNERFVERGDSWHGASSGGSGAAVKSFGSRDTWVSGDRKPEHVGESWARPSANSTRWPGGSASISMSSRSGLQGGISSPMFAPNNIQGMPSMNVGMSLGSFSGGDRFDAYKQPYFKGP